MSDSEKDYYYTDSGTNTQVNGLIARPLAFVSVA